MEAGKADLISSVAHSLARLQLQRQADVVLTYARRASTLAVHRRAHQALTQYAEFFATVALPADPVQLSHWIAWLLTGRDPVLSAPTVDIYVGVVSDWHSVAREVTGLPLANPCHSHLVRTMLRSARAGFTKTPARKEPFTAEQLVRVLHSGFDRSTVGGRHDRLLFCFLLMGPLRPGVAVNLRIHYSLVPDGLEDLGLRVVYQAGSQVRVQKGVVVITVDHDKNVDSSKRREVEIPSCVLGMDVPGDLETYLKVCGPPSGGTLFASPTVPRKQVKEAAPQAFQFNANPYTASCEMVRRSFKRAHPDAEQWEAELFGGGSPRKTLAQLLWSVHHDRRVVVDFGGWSMGREESAVDSYFHLTRDQRLRYLQSLAEDLVAAKELSRETANLCADMT